MQDIAPQLLAAVMKAFQKNLDKNSKIKSLQNKLLYGKLTGNEAELYSVEVGNALARAFHDEINADTLPDGRMYYNIASRVIPPPLHKCYEDVADYAQAMYKGMNERAKLGIKAQRAKYNEDRVNGLIEYASGAEKYADRQKNFEGSLVNYSQSVATDTMKENAEFQFQAGLSPVIRRRGSSDCCGWCKALIGDYPYETVKATGSDVYRRHRDCRCQVYYDPGDGKVQDVHTKRWEDKNGNALQDSVKRKTGALNKGAYNDLNDPYYKHRDKIAEDLYNQIRNRKREYEIGAVAKNSGFSVAEIETVFAHIFEKKHLFSDGTKRRFDPDYYIAHSWLRLREGKDIKRHDITLLRHELAEARIMEKNLEISYEEAHNIVEKRISYRNALLEYLRLHDV